MEGVNITRIESGSGGSIVPGPVRAMTWWHVHMVGHALGLINKIRVHVGTTRGRMSSQTHLRNGRIVRLKVHSLQAF